MATYFSQQSAQEIKVMLVVIVQFRGVRVRVKPQVVGGDEEAAGRIESGTHDLLKELARHSFAVTCFRRSSLIDEGHAEDASEVRC